MPDPFKNWPEVHEYLIEVQATLEVLHVLTVLPFASEEFRSAVSAAVTAIDRVKEMAVDEETKRIRGEREVALSRLRQRGAPELASLLPEELRPQPYDYPDMTPKGKDRRTAGSIRRLGMPAVD